MLVLLGFFVVCMVGMLGATGVINLDGFFENFAAEDEVPARKLVWLISYPVRWEEPEYIWEITEKLLETVRRLVILTQEGNEPARYAGQLFEHNLHYHISMPEPE